MYKFDKNHQFGLADFNQPMGLKMNPENRWVKKAEKIPWEAIEEKYAALFPGKKGMPAKPLRTALGSLLIQKQLQFSDRELVEEIRENPYFQYFIGLPGYQDTIPFVPSLLVEFRKRLTAEVLEEIDLCDDLSKQLATIRTLVEQQQYMYENKVHSVPDRIVSISQPYIRPIARGKAKAPVEFGAKLDLSIDENGIARLERLSFDAYNESEVFITAVENYKSRTGHYPERVLVDQIYRNRTNRAFCSEHGIRISGPALGRPKKDNKVDKKQEYIDNNDRIEVERAFSLAKRRYGLGLITAKLDTNTKSSIALSIIAMNVNLLTVVSFAQILVSLFSRNKLMHCTVKYMKNKYEVRVSYDKDHTLAAASLNLHGTAFTSPFHIKVKGVDNPVSGCVGFGIERWILVFLAQYGTDSACWPDEVKKFIRQKG